MMEPPPLPRMTPHCEKKRSNVLAGHNHSNIGPIATTTDVASVCSAPSKQVLRTYEYTTTRVLLRQVAKKASAVAAICKSIQSRLMLQFQSSLTATIDFEPGSSRWKISRPTGKDPDDISEVQVVLIKHSSPHDDDEKYIVRVSAVPSKLLDVVHYVVRKAVVRLEFPDFPEGLKEAKFRSVYQLNERVSWHEKSVRS